MYHLPDIIYAYIPGNYNILKYVHNFFHNILIFNLSKNMKT